MKQQDERFVDIREQRCAYRHGTTLYLSLLDPETGTGIVFYNKSLCRQPPGRVKGEIACGPRSLYSEEQLKFVQSLRREGCRTRMKKSDVRIWFDLATEAERERLLGLLAAKGIRAELLTGDDGESEGSGR